MHSLKFDADKFKREVKKEAAQSNWSPEEIFDLLTKSESKEAVFAALQRMVGVERPRSIAKVIEARLAYSLGHYDGRYRSITARDAEVVWAWLQGKEAPHKWVVEEFTRGVLDTLRNFSGVGHYKPPLQTYDGHWSWFSRDGKEHRFKRVFECPETGEVRITYKGREVGCAPDQWRAPEVINEFIRRHGLH